MPRCFAYSVTTKETVQNSLEEESDESRKHEENCCNNRSVEKHFFRPPSGVLYAAAITATKSTAGAGVALLH